MPLGDQILMMIEFRTFSSVWYWLAVAVTWAVVCHWILGIPFDMLYRARRQGGAALDQVQALFDIHVQRIMTIDGLAGPWIVAFASFTITVLFLIGFGLGFEFAQGLFLLALPLTVIGGISLQACKRFTRTPPARDALLAELWRLRMIVQTVAMLALFATSVYGARFNVTAPLGL